MAGTLKPNGILKEGTWLVNSALAQYGSGISNLFDGIRGNWSNASTFYWNNSSHFIDITLNQKSAIWVIGNAGYLGYDKPLKVEKWDGTQFVFLTNTSSRTTMNDWEKMIELEKGRYKFSYNSSFRMDDEWFIEEVIPLNKTLIQLSNGEVKYLDGGITPSWKTLTVTTPTKEQFETYGYADLSVITPEQWASLFAIDPNIKLISYIPTGNVVNKFGTLKNSKQIDMSALPKGQILIQDTDFSNSGGIESAIINSINDGKKDGNIKLLLSGDSGSSWVTYKNNAWETVTSIDDIRSKGIKLSEIQNIPKNDMLSITGVSGKIRFAYYLEENVRETDKAIIDNVLLPQELVLNTPSIDDASFYIINTTSTITVDLLGTNLVGEVKDIDLTKVRYRVFLNGNPYYPSNGDFTKLQESPANISVNVYSRDINLGVENTLRVEFEDYWGKTDNAEIKFIGEYVGLIFKTPTGDAYTTEIGEIVKYLDIGTLVAGQVSDVKEVFIHNTLGFDVENASLESYTTAQGVDIELSKTKNPFVAEDKLNWNQLLATGDNIPFYIRLVTKYTTPPNMGGDFTLQVFATKV